MQEFITTFHIDWKLMMAQIVNFGLVFFVFYLLAAKPLSKLIKDRNREIETGLSDAKVNAALIEKTQKEYDEVITKARVKAQKIFEEGKKEAEAKRSIMLEDTKVEVAGIIESGKKSLQVEKTKMVEEAKKEIVSLAMRATEKLINSKKDLNDLL